MAKMGRPKLAEKLGIDFTEEKQHDQLIKFLEVGLTQKDVAHIYGISIDTLSRIINEQLNTTFAELYKKYSVEVYIRNRRNLIKQSDEGVTTASIYLDKRMGGMEEEKRQSQENKDKKLEHEIWRDKKLIKLKEREIEKGTDVNVTFTEEEFFKAFNEVDTSDDLLDGNEVANYQGFDLDE